MNAKMKCVLEALGQVQNKLDVPKSRYSSFGEYHYRSAEDIMKAVKPLLAEVGAVITLSDAVVQVGERYYVESTAAFITADGTMKSTAQAREPVSKKKLDEAQVTGATSSYARKYALCALLLIDDEQDADETNDHGLKLEYVGKLQVLKESYPPKVVRTAMNDFKLEKLTDLPEAEYDNFERLVKGIAEAEKEGEL